MKKSELKQLIKEEIEKSINKNELNFNTQTAVENFKNEVVGNYLVITPAGKEYPETILAYSTPKSTAFIKTRILDMMKMDEYRNNDIHFGQIKWSSKENDKVLSFITFQRGSK
jgi:hypothetical protein